jgi:ABC-type uncharacterized transport system ATPase subunit
VASAVSTREIERRSNRLTARKSFEISLQETIKKISAKKSKRKELIKKLHRMAYLEELG